jgi:type I restriction enzyme S subunit
MENRYDKYKDSGIEWIGEIPEHWKVIKIKNAFSIISGATPKTDNIAYWDGEITWITPADYKTEDIIIKYGKRNITIEGLNSCGTSIVPQGSIIFSKRAPIGLVAINAVPLCTNQGCISCIPKTFVNAKYFYYLMSILTEWFELFGSGTTFKELSTNNFANFSLSQPSLTEQQSIADYLDRKCGEIDELITLQEEMITKLQSYKQSVITEAVTKGLDKNVPLKDSGIEWIGEIPEHWEITKIQYLTQLKSGYNLTTEEIKDSGLYPVYGGNGIRGYYDKYFLEGDYVLIGRQGALCGNINYSTGKSWATEHAVVCYPKTKYITKWFGELLRVMNLNQYSLAAAQPGLAVERIKLLPIPIIPVSEQQAIADYLDQKCGEIDELISIKQQKIEKLKDYKKSLIFECVTGKRKVC